MLKKIIIPAIAIGATVFTGCAGSEYQTMMSSNASGYKEHVVLSEYKGLDVAKVDRSNEEITDEQVNETLEYLKNYLTDYEVVDVAQDGDIVTINATGTIDGKDIEDGTLQDYEYEIGSGMLIDGFDEGLKGKKINDEFEVKAKFPDDYGNEELNGKEAVFKTTLTSIKREKESELNDDFVKNHAEEIKQLKGYGGSTVEELKESIKTESAKENKEMNDQQVAAEVIQTLIEKSEFKSFPEEETGKYTNNIINNIKEEYQSYGTEYETLDSFLEAAYELENEAALNDYAKEQAQEYMKNKMVVTLIAEENGIVVEDEEVEELGKQMAGHYGFESFDKMKEEYGDEVKEDFAYQALYNKVASYLASVSNQVKEIKEEIIEDVTEENLEEAN